jgi:hypothetical protein
MIPVLERGKTIHATVIGHDQITQGKVTRLTAGQEAYRTFLNVTMKGTRNERYLYIPMDKTYIYFIDT